jgi:transposase
VLHDAGFTPKALSSHAAPRNTLAKKQKRRDWCRDVSSTLTAETAIFIDESPFSFCITRSRGRSPKGQEAVTTTPAIRGKNHTVIAALSPAHGLVHYEIKVTEPDTEFISKRKGSKKKKTRPKGVTRERFRSFLINLLAKAPFANSSTPFTLLFDNAKIHLGDIADTIFQAGYVQQLLPSYSPALNPIEYAFSKWKLAYRALHPDSEQAVDDAIHRTAPSITPANCQQWFVHTQSLYDKCLAMEDL